MATFSSHLKGIFFASISALSMALVYLLGNYSQKSIDTSSFLFWWFASASLWGGVLLIFKRKRVGEYLRQIKTHYRFLIYYIVAETVGTMLFFWLVKRTNPAVLAFLNSLIPFFVALFAFFIIGERLTKRELIGGAVSIAGVVIITYVSPDIGLVYLILSLGCFLLFSLTNVLLKKYVGDIPPLLLTLIRIFSLLVVYSVMLGIRGDLQAPPFHEGVALFAGGFFGPILGILSFISALKYCKASLVSLVKNIQPFLVALFAFIALNQNMSLAQLLGGTVIVAGISLLIKRPGASK